MNYDVFISHASEDKDSLVRPLAIALRQLGYSIWYDEFTLKLGDSLRRSIDAGLAKSKFGVVVLSPAFLQKNWPQYELDGLVQRENIQGQKVILPVWHNIDHIAVATYSPSLADRVAASSAAGINAIADKIADALGPAYAGQIEKPLTDSSANRTVNNALIMRRRRELPLSQPSDHTKASRDVSRAKEVLQLKKHDTLNGPRDGFGGCLYLMGMTIVFMSSWFAGPILLSLEQLGFFRYILALILAPLLFFGSLHFWQRALKRVYGE
jgi:hypothetical protein